MSHPVPAPKKVIRVQVEKVVFGGQGLSRDLGKTVLVEGAMSGETVDAEVISEKKNFIEAKVSQVITASPSRVQPPCRHFGWCGGCQYQMMSYDEELRIKSEQVREMLSPLISADKIQPINFSSKEYGYRNSVTFHFVQGNKKQKSQVGFIGVDNKTLIPVQECHLLDPGLASVWARGVRPSNKADKWTFKLSESREIVSDYDDRFFRIKVSRESLLTSSKGFFQNNLAVTEKMVGVVSGWLADPKPSLFLDLFSGMGLFSLLCAKDIPEVVCVEESGPSLEALKMNVAERHRANLSIVSGRVERVFSGLVRDKSLDRATILLDPPRQGLDRSLAMSLSRTRAQRIIYVSCDIPSLVRDLTHILSAGHYQVESVVPFDMFPKTKHIEAAVLLTSKTS